MKSEHKDASRADIFTKLVRNKARDRRVNRTLRKLGWKAARVWEHELRRKDEKKLIRRILRVPGRSA